MEPLDVVKVFYEESVVGQVLVYDSGALGFAYDPSWLTADDSFPLSATLPLSHDEFTDGTIAPWLSNLLPEGGTLKFLERILGVSSSDSLAILEAMGGDLAGAVSVWKPGVSEAYEHELLCDRYLSGDEGDALRGHLHELRRHPFLAGEPGVRISLAGAQEKAALSVVDSAGHPKIGLPEFSDRLAIPKNGAPSTLIVKPAQEILPGIVENEAYCLTLAGLIGVPAAECAVISAGDRAALALVRYDRCVCDDGTVGRLHQEDFAQANGLFPLQKYEDGLTTGLDLRRLLSTESRLHPAEGPKLIDQVIFNLLIANTDAHAKNYSMIHGCEASMAPIYDVLCVPFWSEAQQIHAQRIAGEKMRPSDISRRHWDSIARDAELNAYRLRQRVAELVGRMVDFREEAIQIVADQPGVSAETVRSVAETAEGNALQIGGCL